MAIRIQPGTKFQLQSISEAERRRARGDVFRGGRAPRSISRSQLLAEQEAKRRAASEALRRKAEEVKRREIEARQKAAKIAKAKAAAERKKREIKLRQELARQKVSRQIRQDALILQRQKELLQD
jgi:hypothetical protein